MALTFSAIVVTLLPIPIIYFGILPAYQAHAWFLLFYTPFLCLLTLCYLFYIRDSLARAMFANVLDPPPPPDPYYRESLGERVGRGFRRVKGVVLGILPALLVVLSMYCVSRYVASFNESASLAGERYERSVRSEEVGAIPEDRGRLRKRRSTESSRLEGKPSAPAKGPAADSLPPLSDSTAVRKYLLRTTRIDEIPQLVELTVLYVGAFLALLIAVTLMALKEYAREALGLSEHELMFARYHRRGADE